MRAPIRGALAILLRKSGSRAKRTDWTLVLAWTGIAVALAVVIFVLAVR